CAASASENALAPCETGRVTPLAGLSRRGHARAVIDSSAWLMQSKPVDATTFGGNVAVTSGSINAIVGMRRREMIPVFAFNDVNVRSEEHTSELQSPDHLV